MLPRNALRHFCGNCHTYMCHGRLYALQEKYLYFFARRTFPIISKELYHTLDLPYHHGLLNHENCIARSSLKNRKNISDMTRPLLKLLILKEGLKCHWPIFFVWKLWKKWPSLEDCVVTIYNGLEVSSDERWYSCLSFDTILTKYSNFWARVLCTTDIQSGHCSCEPRIT